MHGENKVKKKITLARLVTQLIIWGLRWHYFGGPSSAVFATLYVRGVSFFNMFELLSDIYLITYSVKEESIKNLIMLVIISANN
jgi:hypothetical protein